MADMSIFTVNHNNNKGPMAKYNGNIIVRGPHTVYELEDDDYDDVISNGEGPSTRRGDGPLPETMTRAVPVTAAGAAPGDGSMLPRPEVERADSAVSACSEETSDSDGVVMPSWIARRIAEKRIRDSLELDKCRMLARRIDNNDFSVPGAKQPRRNRGPDALNVVRPYPRLKGFGWPGPAPCVVQVDLGPGRGLKRRHSEPVSVTYTPGGSVLVAKVPDEQPQEGEGKADVFARAGGIARRFRYSLEAAKARIMGTGKGPALEPKRGILKKQPPRANDKGKGKAVEFAEPAEA